MMSSEDIEKVKETLSYNKAYSDFKHVIKTLPTVEEQEKEELLKLQRIIRSE